MVRILVASRRPCAAEALATSSYGTNFDQPLSADTLVMAAVRVVLPWSTCPMVPTFTCGFVRSNLFFAIAAQSPCSYQLSVVSDQLLVLANRYIGTRLYIVPDCTNPVKQ